MPSILPNLPTSQSVFSDVALQPQRIDASPASFGGILATGEQQFGQGLERAGAQAGDVALQRAQIANETNVNDAYYKNYFPAVTNLTQTYLQTGGKDAVDKFPAYQQQLEQLRQQQRDQLNNPMAQRMFDEMSRRLNMFQMDGAARHQSQQQQLYEDNTSQGMTDAAGSLAVQRWNDPNAFNSALQSGVAEIMTHAQYRGQPVEWAQAKAQDFTSRTYAARLKMMADSDPIAAWNLLQNGETYTDTAGNQRHVDVQEQLGAQQLPALTDYIRKQVMPVAARNIVQTVMSGGSLVDGDRISDLHAAVKQAESAGNPNAVGPNVPGQGTAKGSMQVMDATNANPGFGVRPAADNSAAERARVGNDYLDAMIARYGGDQTLALAAYNWGPRKVDALIQNAKGAGVALNDSQLVAQMPPDTRAYIAKINAAVPPRAGVPPTDGDPRAHLADWQASASALASSLYPNDPQFRDTVQSNLFNETNKIVAGQQGTELAARDRLVSAAIGAATPGATKPTSLADLLSSPGLKSDWAALKPEQQVGIMDLVDHNAKNTDPPITTDTLTAFNRLKGEATNDPEAFANEDLTKYFATLPHSFSEQLINLQATVTGRASRDQDRALNLQHAMEVARPSLLAAGVYIPGQKDSPEKAADYNTFTGRMADALDGYYTQNKKAPTDIDVRNMVNSLLVQGVDTSKSAHFWSSSPAPARAFQVQNPQDFQVPAPEGERSKIIAAWQAVHPGETPSDSVINTIYTRSTMTPKRPTRGAGNTPQTGTTPNPLASNG